VKCELVKVSEDSDEREVLFTGTIDCDPDECQIIMHRGQAFAIHDIDDDEGLVAYALTKVAEFTEGKD
jgi:hypothetical protein